MAEFHVFARAGTRLALRKRWFLAVELINDLLALASGFGLLLLAESEVTESEARHDSVVDVEEVEDCEDD